MKKIKLKWKILLIILLIFALWNAVWFIYCFAKYRPYQKAIGYDSELQRYIFVDSDRNVYSVKWPNYLSFTGNLAICPTIHIDSSCAEDKITANLIIWPLVTGEFEFGVSIRIIDEERSTPTSAVFKSYNYMLDSHKQPTEALNEKEQKIFDENKELIDSVYKKAYDMWGIGG